MNLDRRHFLKYAAAAIIGGSATTLSSQYLLSDISRPSGSVTTTTTRIDDIEKRYRPPGHLDFMEWLQSVSEPYKGNKLVTAFELEPSPLALQRLDPDFFKFTEILMGYELSPFTQNLLNISLAMSTNAPTYDLVNVDDSHLARFKDNLISPPELAERFPDLTYNNLDLDDFYKIGWSFSAKYPQDLIFPPYEKNLNGSIVQWPQDMPMMIRFYRKDLYEQEGITPGKTWDEYLEDIKMFDNPANGVFGAGSMALPHHSIIFEFLNHLHSFGGKIWEIDDDGLRCVIDSDEAVAALENFIRFRPYSDPASSGSTWSELGLLMAVGRVANAIQFADYASVVNNPDKSTTPGKWGYTAIPSGPEGSFSTFAGAGIGIPKQSKNLEASWLWLQYATHPGTQIMSLQDPLHHFAPTRTKVYDDPIIQQEIESGKLEYLKVVQDIISSSHIATLISFPGWPQVRIILSDRISRAWLGRIEPREALRDAKETIDKEGPIFNF